MINDIDKFFARTRHFKEKDWLKVIKTELYSLDWPISAGGFSWNRSEKLDFVKRLIESGCPLFPENLTLTAPLLIQTERTALLNKLKTNLNEARLMVTHDKIGLEIERELHVIASGDEIDAYISMAFSPLYQIYELRSTIFLIHVMDNHWQKLPDPQVTQLNIELKALETLYLRNDGTADLQIGLKCNKNQLNSYTLLFQALGYYALLDPDPILSANEHIPFQEERRHLRRLRELVGRNEMLQRDQIFERQLEALG